VFRVDFFAANTKWLEFLQRCEVTKMFFTFYGTNSHRHTNSRCAGTALQPEAWEVTQS